MYLLIDNYLDFLCRFTLFLLALFFLSCYDWLPFYCHCIDWPRLDELIFIGHVFIGHIIIDCIDWPQVD